jgi:hypothetical protein
MLGTASSPSTRIVSARLICLGTVLFAFFGLLALSPVARADSTVEALPEGVTSERTPEGSSGGSEAAAAESQPAGPGEGATSETTSTEGSPAEALSEESSGGEAVDPVPTEPAPELPVGESTPEPLPVPEPVPAPVEVKSEPAPPVSTPEATKESAPETSSHASSEEKEKPKEKSAEAAATMAGSPGAPASTVTGLIAVAPESAPPSGPVPPTGSEIVQLGEGQEASDVSSEEALTGPRGAAERQAVTRRCELSALGGPEAGGCDGGWLGATSTLTSTPVALVSDATALAPAAVSSSGDDGPGGVAGGGRPLTPTPGPAPGGASGGVAAGGAGSVGLSGFWTLAGLLLLAAPRAMRRLRLSCSPWLTAFFVLIPERPG